MKNLNRRIKNCLNNENGGPNLENLVAIGVSIVILAGLLVFKDRIYNAIKEIMVKASVY